MRHRDPGPTKGSWQRRPRRVASLCWMLLVSALAGAANAGTVDPADIPEPLRDWIPWVLDGHELARCPEAMGPEERSCAWPSRLALDVDEDGAHFTMEWRVFAETFAPLPGDEHLWPRDVRVDDKAGVVLMRAGRPALRLAPGIHRVSGALVWRSRPTLLPVPPEIGLLTVVRGGERMALPEREPDGRVWLGARAKQAVEAEHVVLDVRRLVRDEIPLELTMLLDLDVAGANRELRIADGVLEGFMPLALESELPARIADDGGLVVQVRPGHFTLRLLTRARASLTQIARPPAVDDGALRDADEVWAFESRPALRVVDVQGGTSVDPAQTTLPREWHGFPAFVLTSGQSLQWIEKRRGDADPAPDALSLARTLWLDFDGGGFTVQDRWTGELHRSWRLEASPEITLGRVAIDGRDQPITRLRDGDASGVELRAGMLSLVSDARIAAGRSVLPAVGWRHDALSLAAELRLPPGWQLVHASGVDAASPSWLTSWTLLDLFLVLVIPLAAMRLFGAATGALALAALVLSWMEPGALRWIWAAALAAEALVRLVHTRAWSRALRAARLAVLLWLCVSLVAFAVGHLRVAFYPALARGGAPLVSSGQEAADAIEGVEKDFAAAPQAEDVPVEMLEEGGASAGDVVPRTQPRPRSKAPGRERYAVPYVGSGSVERTAAIDPGQLDPSVAISTGPGLPSWRWQRVRLEWRGPVNEDESLRFWLLSPRERFLLAWLCVSLVVALALVLLRGASAAEAGGGGSAGGPTPDGVDPSGPRRLQDDTAASVGTSATLRGGALALGLCAGSLLIPAHAAADYPTPELLEQLRERVLREPTCRPDCVTIGWLRVEATGDSVRLRLEIDADAETVLPLPGDARALALDAVLLDGAPANALRRAPDGTLFAVVPPGRHQVLLDARAPGSGDVVLVWPLRPRVVETALAGWRLEGVSDDGKVGSALRLVRVRATPSTADGSPVDARGDETRALPPFFHVVRTLSLGLRWTATTTLVRVTPPGVAATLTIPLMPGESPTSDAVHVENGAVRIPLGPQQLTAEWESVLEPTDRLALRAAEDASFAERWRLDASALWHIDTTGIPPIHEESAGRVARIREWRPWPGEEVAFAISRPGGVVGATLTLDRAQLDVAPGLRATDVTLQLDVRSSRGGQHVVTLPQGAELQQVTIDGEAQPLRLEGERLALPLAPGTRAIVVRWRDPHGVARVFRTPVFDLGAPAVNVGITVAMPLDRWTLLLRGPGVGPAILFWSTLAVLAALAVGLARTRLTPLGFASWLLLGIGLTQVSIEAAALVVATLLALGWRARAGARLSDGLFRLVQLALFGLGAASLAVLFAAIRQGLLGLPEMQIAGNASTAQSLRWYVDRTNAVVPSATILSTPLFVYRLAMLAWALWLAAALLRWFQFAADALTAGGAWRSVHWRPRKAGEMKPSRDDEVRR